jgi:hypothetical protein
MKLVNPTDRELDAVFAEKVAGWKYDESEKAWFHDGYFDHRPLPFTQSADAVLPYLNKMEWWNISRSDKPFSHCEVMIHDADEVRGYRNAQAEHVDPIKAAVIALLRAHGVEVEFTT